MKFQGNHWYFIVISSGTIALKDTATISSPALAVLIYKNSIDITRYTDYGGKF